MCGDNRMESVWYKKSDGLSTTDQIFGRPLIDKDWILQKNIVILIIINFHVITTIKDITIYSRGYHLFFLSTILSSIQKCSRLFEIVLQLYKFYYYYSTAVRFFVKYS